MLGEGREDGFGSADVTGFLGTVEASLAPLATTRNAAWWDLVSRHQLVTPPPERNAPDWADKIHIAIASVYYHIYLYGSIVASQLHDALRGAAGGIVERPEAGQLLAKKLFAPGLSVRWDRLVEQATGSPLSVDALAREVAAAQAA